MELSFKIKKPIDFVFEQLEDMQKFASCHPVISKIDSTGNNNYLVYETLKIGFIPFSFTYPVTIESNIDTQTISYYAVVMKLTKIKMNFVLTTESEYTIIRETIEFNSPLPVKNIMGAIFKKQHTQLFKNIESAKSNI
jgi:carbon monoxide dehydrogenase subunit G